MARTLYGLIAAAALTSCDRPAQDLMIPVSELRFQDDKELFETGKKIFSRNCINCHFIPDATIERDKVWIELNKTTA